MDVAMFGGSIMEEKNKGEASQYKAMIYALGGLAIMILAGYFLVEAGVVKMS